MLSAKVYSFFVGTMYFTSLDGSQSMSIYQPIPDTLELKKDKCMDYALSWKSKWVHTFELTPLYATFLNSTKLSGCRTGIKFNNNALVKEQNNYSSKNVNVYIVYDLHTWSKNPLKNFALKNWLFGASNIVKNNVEEKFVYSGYEIASDGAGEWVLIINLTKML